MNMKQPDKVSTHGAQLTQAEGCGSNDPRAMKSSWTVEASPDWKRKEQHVKVRMGSFSYLLHLRIWIIIQPKILSCRRVTKGY